MRITMLQRTITYASRAGGVSASELAELSGATLRDSRETLRDMLAAGIINRSGHTYKFNANCYLVDIVLRAIAQVRENEERG